MVFQISEEDVERSSTLENKDVGKWAFVMNGCIQFINAKSQDEAIKIYREIFA